MINFWQRKPKFNSQWAVVDDQSLQATSYNELHTIAETINIGLPAEKQLIALLCTNSTHCLAGYLAALKGKHPVLLLDGRAKPELVFPLLQTYQPNYVWKPEHWGKSDTPLGHHYSLMPFFEESHNLHPDLAVLLTTSGSTGSPKLVRLSFDNIQENAESIAEYLDLTNEERPITTLPMFYSYGLSVINSHLHRGGCILMTDKSIMTKEFWQFANDWEATSFAGVPYTYDMVKRMDLLKFLPKSVHTLTQAGGKLSEENVVWLGNFAKETERRFFVMYGQTEATARMTYLPADLTLAHPSSIGIPIPRGKMSLLDEFGNEIKTPNIVGELIYQGPNVMMGYAENIEDLAKPDELEGVLETGDMGYFNSDGLFFIAGRKKRFIKLFGTRVGLDEVEQTLLAQGLQCAVSGKDNLLVIAYLNTDKLESDVRKEIAKQFNFAISAIQVFRVESFALSAAGKPLYAEIFKGKL